MTVVQVREPNKGFTPLIKTAACGGWIVPQTRGHYVSTALWTGHFWSSGPACEQHLRALGQAAIAPLPWSWKQTDETEHLLSFSPERWTQVWNLIPARFIYIILDTRQHSPRQLQDFFRPCVCCVATKFSFVTALIAVNLFFFLTIWKIMFGIKERGAIKDQTG